MFLLFAIPWALLITGLLLRAVRQFHAYQVLEPGAVAGAGGLPPVSVVVPARNEAGNIAACVAGLAAQDYPGKLDLLVIDDNSSDGTAFIARKACKARRGFRVAAAGRLPEGWTGKSHACWQGARQTAGKWLCFLDADTRPAPPLLATAVAWAEANGVGLLSLEPEQELGSFWERVILPAGMFMMAFFTVDLRAINDPRAGEAAANGQFILIRRQIYEAIGGHAAVRAEISEDLVLARRAKAAHFRPFLMGTRNLVRVRMYHRLGEIWEGLSKNAVNCVPDRTRAALTALGGFLFAWASLLLPAGAAWAWALDPGPAAAAAALLAGSASLALFLTHIAGARYFRVRGAYGLLFPLGYTLVAAIVLNSIRVYREGAVRWKGRLYAPQKEEGAPPQAEREPARGGKTS